MQKEEFIVMCNYFKYCSKEEARKYTEQFPKDDYTEEDYEEVEKQYKRVVVQKESWTIPVEKNGWSNSNSQNQEEAWKQSAI